MADLVFNIAKGKAAYYASLPAANDALIVIPIQTTGVESDAIIRDYDTVAAILAGTTDEQVTMGRKTVTTATVTTNDTTDVTSADIADQVWTAATGNAVSDLLIAYDPDTTVGTDADLIPLTWHDFAVTPDGSNITAQISASGFFSAS